MSTAGSDDAEQWVDARLLALLNGRSGGAMAKSLRAMVKSHNLDAEVAQPVERAAQYLVNNTCLLHYDRALAEGLPIATGVVEGACRYLVKDRMGRTGACWSLTCAEAILRLRALGCTIARQVSSRFLLAIDARIRTGVVDFT